MHAKPQAKFDLASVGHVDRLVGGATLVLFISLFLPWFSVHLPILGTYTADGLSAHGYLYITLILAIGIIAFLAVEALGLWSIPATSQLAREQLLLIATGINFVLVLIGFLFKPGGSGYRLELGSVRRTRRRVRGGLPTGLARHSGPAGQVPPLVPPGLLQIPLHGSG